MCKCNDKYDLNYFRQPKLHWNSSDDEELAVKLLYGNNVQYVSDNEMTKYLQMSGVISIVGSPDATIFEEGADIKDGVWNNVTMLQVFRGYHPEHLYTMIKNKLHKCQKFLKLMHNIGKFVTVKTFMFGIYVPSNIIEKSTQIVIQSNKILTDTVYKLKLLDLPSSYQKYMFRRNPSHIETIRNWEQTKWFGCVKDKTIEDMKAEIVREQYIFETPLDDEDMGYCLSNLFSPP
jgi:hypothetical protein